MTHFVFLNLDDVIDNRIRADSIDLKYQKSKTEFSAF